jgi:hypothetical protein
MTVRERQLARKRAKRPKIQGSAPDAGKIPGVLGMQNVLNGVSMAVGVMEMALYSSYTPYLKCEELKATQH